MPRAGLALAVGAVAGGSLVPGRSGWGGVSGAGSGAAPSAGVAMAQGLAGVQPEGVVDTELTGGVTTATVLGAPRTCAKAGAASTTLRAKRQEPSLTSQIPKIGKRGEPRFKRV